MPPELTPCPCDTCNGEFCNGKNCDAWRQWFWPQWRLQCDELLRRAGQKEMPAPADTEREQQEK